MNASADVRRGVLPASPKLRMLLLLVLAVLAAVSLRKAISEAVTIGIDFQWSGAHILANHQDPWNIYIDGDPDHQIILAQQPNYLAEMFLLLGPLGRMSFLQALQWWCALNLIFLAGVIFCLRGIFHLDRDHTLLITFLILCSTPFRVTMANGQHGLFILCMLCLLFYFSNRVLRGLSLGLSYSKYSFAPLLVMVLLIRRQFTEFIISIIPPVIGIVIAQHILGGSFKTLAFEPIATSKLAMGPGSGDIMTPLDLFMRNRNMPLNLVYTIPALLGLAAAVAAAIWIGRNKRLNEAMVFAVTIIMTLLCFKHVLYDFVVLIVPVAAAVMAPRSRARTVVLVCMAHFWFLTSIINHFFPERVYVLEVAIYAVILFIMALATSRLYEVPEAEAVPAS